MMGMRHTTHTSTQRYYTASHTHNESRAAYANAVARIRDHDAVDDEDGGGGDDQCLQAIATATDHKKNSNANTLW